MGKDSSRKSRFHFASLGGALSVGSLLAICGAIAIGLVRGLGPLEQRAASIISTAAPRVTIAWPTLPERADHKQYPDGTWLAEQFQEELLRRASDSLARSGSDPFGRAALGQLCESMRTSGWFEGTPTVSRRSGGEIHVSGKWRIAAAVVRDGNRDRLLSWNAQVMPVEYGSGQSGLTIIRGTGSKSPRTPQGQVDYLAVWPGEDVVAALELLAVVRQQSWAAQVAGIDVSRFEKTRQLELLTRTGGRVVWGGRPSAPLRGESTTVSKLAKIDRLNRDFRVIDAGRPAVEIFWEAQPLEIDVSATAMKQ